MTSPFAAAPSSTAPAKWRSPVMWQSQAAGSPRLSLARKTAAPVQLICPCVVGRKDLMTKFYPAAVGDTTRPGQTKSASGRWCRHNRRCKPPPLTPGYAGQAGWFSEMHVIIAMMRNFAVKRRPQQSARTGSTDVGLDRPNHGDQLDPIPTPDRPGVNWACIESRAQNGRPRAVDLSVRSWT